jgi:hypothetical protein
MRIQQSLKGGFFGFFLFYVRYSTLLHLPPLRFHLSEDAGIEPRTVATTALAVSKAKQSGMHYFTCFPHCLDLRSLWQLQRTHLHRQRHSGRRSLSPPCWTKIPFTLPPHQVSYSEPRATASRTGSRASRQCRRVALPTAF